MTPRRPLEPPAGSDPAEHLARLLERAEQRIRAQIAALALSGATASQAYREKHLAAVLASLENVRRSGMLASRTVAAQSYAAGLALADRAQGIVPAFGGNVHEREVRAIADALAGSVSDSVLEVGRRVQDVYRTAGLTASGSGIAAGEARREVSRAMLADLQQQGVTSFVDRAGRRWSMGAYTRMVARTTTRQAMTVGTVTRMREQGADLVAVSDHGDTDDLCAEYAGNTYSLSGDTPGYDVLDDYPPFHPNCEHVLLPATATLDTLEQSLADSGWL